MQYSHSRVECFEGCPHKYQMRYNQKLRVINDYEYDNPLIIGTAMHKAIQGGYEYAEKWYMNQFLIMSDEGYNELLKIEILSEKARKLLPEKYQFECPIITKDFIGYADMIHFEGDSLVITDFKYSNSNYKDSLQLHLYRYFAGQEHRNVKLRYMYIPKASVNRLQNEPIEMYRKRIRKAYNALEPTIENIEYNPSKVMEWYSKVKKILENPTFDEKSKNFMQCKYCEYKDYCQKGHDYMLLPENKRRTVAKINKKVIWIYGASFSGKTYFANQFPDPLMLNTDGNVKFVDAPYIAIKNIVEQEGRITKTTPAWQVFKDAVIELEKKQNTFKTIVVDLVEDLYEYCRLYMYEKQGFQHESDAGFGKGYDLIRTEFLSTIKRLINCDYENIILISHESTEKDITRKSGSKITEIKPNLNEKTIKKIAGMTDITARVVADGDTRELVFEKEEGVLSGGRIDIRKKRIPLTYDALMDVYGVEEPKEEPAAKLSGPIPAGKPNFIKEEQEPEPKEYRPIPVVEIPQATIDGSDAAPKPRTRRRRVAEGE